MMDNVQNYGSYKQNYVYSTVKAKCLIIWLENKPITNLDIMKYCLKEYFVAFLWA
jgi:hypothetical protein